MRNPYWSKSVDLTGEATNPGEEFARIFEPYFDGSTTSLREVGKRNIQEEMDAYAPYTDIAYMLNQLKVGDTSVLSHSEPYYGDFSDLSNNPADVINTVRSAETAFGQLPASVRSSYGNDWRVWFTAQLQASSNPVPVDGPSDPEKSVVRDVSRETISVSKEVSE